MFTFDVVDYHWDRTTLFLEFSSETPVSAQDTFVLKGMQFNPALDDEPFARTITLSNVYLDSETRVRIRFMVANGGFHVFPGDYQLLVHHYGADYPVSLADGLGRLDPVSTKRKDMLFYARTSSYFEVIPHTPDGSLWFNVNAKGFPKKFGYHARSAFTNACKTFTRALVNEVAVTSFYTFKKLFPYNANKVLFTSDSRADLSGNMEPLYARMQECGLDKSKKVVFSFKSAKRANKSRSVPSYIRLAYHLATAGTVFCDDFQPYLYHVRYDDRTRLVQLWHACGHFKTVGFGRIGTVDAVAPYSNDHKRYTDVIVASDSDIPVYAEAFGIPDERVKSYGIPRHDWLLDPQWQAGKKAVFQQTFPAAAGKRVIVFAPTFRGAGKSTAWYDYSRIDFAKLTEFCRSNGFFFIFKMHPFISALPQLPEGSEDVFADGSAIREINDILPSTDYLITDYSSVVYEAALLNIPTLYFAYDLEEYISSRSFYEPYEEFVSGRIVRTFDELLQALGNNDCGADLLEEFRKKNFRYLDGKACDRIIDHILLGKPEADAVVPVSYSAADVCAVSLSQDAGSINQQIAATDKRFILFTDDEATFAEDYVQQVLQVFSNDPEIGAASGLVRTHKGKLLSNEKDTKTEFIYHDAAMNFKQVKLLPYGMVYRTEVIKQGGLQFDEELTYCRDELFAIQYAQINGKAARVNGAVYRTGIELDESSTKTAQSDDVRWYFDSTLPLMQKLLGADGTLSKIAQYGLLYLMIQRFKSNQGQLYKMCFGGLERSNEYLSQAGEVLRHISNEVLFCRADAVKWERYKLMYLAQLRNGGAEPEYDVVAADGDALLFLKGAHEIDVAKMSELTVNVTGLEEAVDQNGQRGLNLVMSFMRCFPSDSFEIHFTNTCGGESHDVVAQRTTQLSALIAFFDEDAAVRDTYKAFIPLFGEGCSQKISAYIVCQGVRIKRNISFWRANWNNKLLANSEFAYWRLGNSIARSTKGLICIDPASAEDFAQAEAKVQETLEGLAAEAEKKASAAPENEGRAKTAKKMHNLARWRKMYWDTQANFEGKTIWAYYDKSYKAGDNAEYAFRYACQQDDGIEKVFYIDPNSADGQRLAAEGYRVLEPGTDEATMYALRANVIFMTHVPPYAKLGLDGTLLPYFKDLLKAKVVRLYHGFPTARSASYSQVSHNAAAVVVATNYERDLYMGPDNGFTADQIITSGMPRYDDLAGKTNRQLLFAPTWRPSLTGKSLGGGKSEYNPEFVNSEYCKRYRSVFGSPKLLECARRNGYKVKMYLHPTLAAQVDDFEGNDVVESVSSVQGMDYVTIMKQSDLMVTDYSSVQYDFAYMRKPVVYYHDPVLPYWRKPSFDYENLGLGEVCCSVDELVDTLCDYMERDCALRPKFAQRIESFYIQSDRQASKRLYEAVRGMF